MPDQVPYANPTPAPSLEEIRKSHSSGIFFYISLLAFLLVIAAYGGLIFLNRAQQTAQQEVLAQIDQKRQELRPELVQQIFSLENRFNAMKSLIQKHMFPSRTLAWLEQHTHPRVAFATFAFDSTSRKLALTGTADSLVSLNQQIAIFQQDPDIEKFEFNGLSLKKEAEGAGFNATVIFKPAFLQVTP
ncbi:MAG: hypothetical protein HY617_02560 [Candidatus Sungbacteria bacterium]|nr:hypothetical protein [Candidatus Sungbacteria bacterium]